MKNCYENKNISHGRTRTNTDKHAMEIAAKVPAGLPKKAKEREEDKLEKALIKRRIQVIKYLHQQLCVSVKTSFDFIPRIVYSLLLIISEPGEFPYDVRRNFNRYPWQWGVRCHSKAYKKNR
jgi:hypothetical protein